MDVTVRRRRLLLAVILAMITGILMGGCAVLIYVAGDALIK